MKRRVVVTQVVEVEVDESKFTEEWMADWRKSFYNFHTVEQHIRHIAQLRARGMLDPTFSEGYGHLSNMGIKVRLVAWDTEIEKP